MFWSAVPIAERQSLHLHELVPAASVEDDPQKIYDPIPMTDDVFNLNWNDLDLQETLGKLAWVIIVLHFPEWLQLLCRKKSSNKLQKV